MLMDLTKLLARLLFGAVMLFSHGLPKILSFSQNMNTFPDPLGVGSSLSLGLTIFAEFACALLITLGLFTRLASIPLIVTMLVAVFVIHANDAWARKELGFLFLGGYLLCLMLNSGRFSLDHLFRKKG